MKMNGIGNENERRRHRHWRGARPQQRVLDQRLRRCAGSIAAAAQLGLRDVFAARRCSLCR